MLCTTAVQAGKMLMGTDSNSTRFCLDSVFSLVISSNKLSQKIMCHKTSYINDKKQRLSGKES